VLPPLESDKLDAAEAPARPARRVSAAEAASRYGRPAPEAAIQTIPPTAPPYDSGEIKVEDEYDVPAYQRRLDTLR
jgi:hypothetical protein